MFKYSKLACLMMWGDQRSPVLTLRCNTFMVKWKRLYKASFFIMGEDIFDGSDTYV
jgi:hypothetical protein